MIASFICMLSIIIERRRLHPCTCIPACTKWFVELVDQRKCGLRPRRVGSAVEQADWRDLLAEWKSRGVKFNWTPLDVVIERRHSIKTPLVGANIEDKVLLNMDIMRTAIPICFAFCRIYIIYITERCLVFQLQMKVLWVQYNVLHVRCSRYSAQKCSTFTKDTIGEGGRWVLWWISEAHRLCASNETFAPT